MVVMLCSLSFSIRPLAYTEALTLSDRLGRDGPWSTFLVGAGNPAQYCDVFVSTNTNQPWFVHPQGCTANDPPTCMAHRGYFYESRNSSSWEPKGNYTINDEQNLGLLVNGEFGFDNLSLGFKGSGLPNLEHQLIVGIASKNLYIASLGINPAATNLTNHDNPIPTLLSTLKQQQLVYSLSWAYTAGSFFQYQSTSLNTLSSLAYLKQLTSKAWRVCRSEDTILHSFVLATWISNSLKTRLEIFLPAYGQFTQMARSCWPTRLFRTLILWFHISGLLKNRVTLLKGSSI